MAPQPRTAKAAGPRPARPPTRRTLALLVCAALALALERSLRTFPYVPRELELFAVVLAKSAVLAAGVAGAWALGHSPRALGLAWPAPRGRPLMALAVLAAFLVGPYAVPALTWTGALTRAPAGLDLYTLVSQLAPTVESSWAVRGVAFFAFAQAAHYIVWLRLVPELERPSPRPRSFRQTGRALVRELSPYLVAFFGLSTLVFVASLLTHPFAALLLPACSAAAHTRTGAPTSSDESRLSGSGGGAGRLPPPRHMSRPKKSAPTTAAHPTR